MKLQRERNIQLKWEMEKEVAVMLTAIIIALFIGVLGMKIKFYNDYYKKRDSKA